MALIDFTLSNARRFYSSMGSPLGLKGLKVHLVFMWSASAVASFKHCSGIIIFFGGRVGESIGNGKQHVQLLEVIIKLRLLLTHLLPVGYRTIIS